MSTASHAKMSGGTSIRLRGERFLTLLWFEFLSRGTVLASVLVALSLCAFLSHYGRFGIGAEAGFLTQVLALFGVVYCATFRGTKNSFRPPWHGFVLPVQTHTLLMVLIVSQTVMAGAIAMPWSVTSFVSDNSYDFATPFLTLCVISSHVHAAQYWIVALGVLRGALCYVLGLLPTALVCLLTISPDSFLLTLCVAALAGWASTGVAAASIRRKPEIFALRPHSHTADVSATQPSGASPIERHLPLQTLTRTLSPSTFHSPLHAQVWFEFRRSAMWLPILILTGSVISELLDRLGAGIGATVISLVFSWGVPIGFSIFHNQLGTRHSSFVQVRPVSTQCLGRAKLLALLIGVVPAAAISSGLLVMPIAMSGPWSITPIYEALLFGLLPVLVLAVFGTLAVGAAIVSGFVNVALTLLAFFTIVQFLAPDFELGNIRNYQVPGLDVITYLLGAWLVLGRFARLKGLDFEWPRELRTAVALLLPIPALYLALTNNPLREFVQFWYVWMSPFLTLAALLAFGLRRKFVTTTDVVVAFVCFLILFSFSGYYYAAINTSGESAINMHFGHWCVLLVSPVVWYPFIVASQRHVDNSRNQGD